MVHEPNSDEVSVRRGTFAPRNAQRSRRLRGSVSSVPKAKGDLSASRKTPSHDREKKDSFSFYGDAASRMSRVNNSVNLSSTRYIRTHWLEHFAARMDQSFPIGTLLLVPPLSLGSSSIRSTRQSVRPSVSQSVAVGRSVSQSFRHLVRASVGLSKSLWGEALHRQDFSRCFLYSALRWENSQSSEQEADGEPTDHTCIPF